MPRRVRVAALRVVRCGRLDLGVAPCDCGPSMPRAVGVVSFLGYPATPESGGRSARPTDPLRAQSPLCVSRFGGRLHAPADHGLRFGRSGYAGSPGVARWTAPQQLVVLAGKRRSIPCARTCGRGARHQCALGHRRGRFENEAVGTPCRRRYHLCADSHLRHRWDGYVVQRSYLTRRDRDFSVSPPYGSAQGHELAPRTGVADHTTGARTALPMRTRTRHTDAPVQPS